MQVQSFNDVNFDGFDADTIQKIKENCLRFLNFEFAYDADYQEIIDENTTYSLRKIQDGVNLQATPKSKNPTTSYEYGIFIFKEENMIKFLVYHNPHG